MNSKLLKKVIRIEDNRNDAETQIFYVKAVSKIDAINNLEDAGVNIYKKVINSPYDCTGQWFWGDITTRQVKWCKSNKCYVIKRKIYCDI